MALNDAVEIPSDEDLTVPEVKLSGVVLRAGAMHLGKYCENQNNEFVLCRDETEDPSACVEEGKAVTSCALEFFRKVKSKCDLEFKAYYKCIDRSSPDYQFVYCRKTQKLFDNCLQDFFEMERPPYGYFCRAKVHETDRPKPEEEPTVFEASLIPDELPADYVPERPRAKYGARNLLNV